MAERQRQRAALRKGRSRSGRWTGRCTKNGRFRLRVRWVTLLLFATGTVRGSAVKGQELPLGDGHVTDHPATGNVFACRLTFRGRGARHDGPWFHDGTWSPAEKPHVAGRVFWPEASYTLKPGPDDLILESNGLPVRQPTGIFPIAPTDSVYRYDTNPNRIAAQNLRVAILDKPVAATQPGCLPMGMIGFTVTGVALFNALDDAGRDAAAHEIQDLCDGHPQANSQYHYHNGSPCIPGADADGLVGWALDGYPILGMKDAQGEWLSNDDLDECHGRAERVMVEQRTYEYVYHLTREYPYTLGCFHGRLGNGVLEQIRSGLLAPRRGPRGRGSATDAQR